MSKPTKQPMKHVPQRTCVGCHVVLPKRSLMRIVRTAEGVRLDPSGKVNGRGAYLHNVRSCWEQALIGQLAAALKTELSDQDRLVLKEAMSALPPENTNAG